MTELLSMSVDVGAKLYEDGDPDYVRSEDGRWILLRRFKSWRAKLIVDQRLQLDEAVAMMQFNLDVVNNESVVHGFDERFMLPEVKNIKGLHFCRRSWRSNTDVQIQTGMLLLLHKLVVHVGASGINKQWSKLLHIRKENLFVEVPQNDYVYFSRF
ncbi:hypothetical protein BV898_06507 [Hypsibius exemplaris]|uniref:Uncharacterized protein n=1 Tax=Hypsibius exemplaris TaxID=2072580 RepID=A0A1W0WWE1_HYPEX|nr:hypothetical protein BV898_06507 [Hypsibius exemplaris]